MAMENRLHEAAIEGNVPILLELLQQDPLLLDMAILSPYQSPLHIAALLGHSDFAIKLLQLKPQIAHDLDSRGFSPLHLAATKGHFEIVRNLLQIDSQLCLVRDADGRNPLHLAAINGRLQTLQELIKARPEAARTTVDHGGTVLHLCVKNNQLESLKLLIKAIDDTIFINAKDDYGFTILHLAVSNKHLQTVEFLVKTKGMEVNAVNSNGFTPLDVLIQSNRNIKDLDIAKLLGAFGAQTSPPPRSNQKGGGNGGGNGGGSGSESHWLSSERDALMVVASVMATMAFQAGINPSGGFWQDDDDSDPMHVAGKSIMAAKYRSFFPFFTASITAAFLLSFLAVYLLMFCFTSSRTLRVLVHSLIGISFIPFGVAYVYSIKTLTPEPVMPQVKALFWTYLGAACFILLLIFFIYVRARASAGRIANSPLRYLGFLFVKSETHTSSAPVNATSA